MSNKKLFDKVLKNHKNKKEEFEKIVNINKNIKFNFITEPNKKIIEIIDDKTNKPLLKAYHRTIGIYNIVNSIWYWAWNIDFIDKSAIIDKSKFTSLEKNIKNNYYKDNSKDIDELYFYITNNNFYMTQDRISNLIKVILYIEDGKWVVTKRHYDHTMQDDNGKNPLLYIEYIILDNIIQYN